MTSVPPPQGMNELDYEAIEAAVTETVRGRWFLAEFARRNRLAETRQLLEALSRIETAVAANQVALPSADPSIRLLIQRIKEVATQLGTVADDLREAGVDDDLVAAVELQARAVSGMMRSAAPAREALPPRAPLPRPESLAPDILPSKGLKIPDDATRVPARPMQRMLRADLPPLPPSATSAPASSPPPVTNVADEDPRLAALSGLDSMTLAKKLAMFS